MLNKIYLTDNELVDKFVSGDMNSLELLINRYRKQVYTYIFLLVKNQHLAEDIFQDTFIKVIKSLDEGKYQDNGKFLAWVLRIAHNLVIDHYRKEKQLNATSREDFGTGYPEFTQICCQTCRRRHDRQADQERYQGID